MRRSTFNIRRLKQLVCLVCALGAVLTVVLNLRNKEGFVNKLGDNLPEVATIFDADLYEARLANASGWSKYRPINKTALRLAFKQGRIPCWRIGQLYPNTIPPIVHFTSKLGVAMERHQPYLKSWRRLLNSTAAGFRFMHWTDSQLNQLIGSHYPMVYRAYRLLTNGLERSDIGRLVVLHHVGGIYADLDVELRRDDLSQLLTNYSAIWSQEPIEHAIFLFEIERLVSNALIISRPGHEFISYVLRRWPAWFQRNWANRKRSNMQAVHTTGPIMLNNFYETYIDEINPDQSSKGKPMLLAEPDMFQPIWDSAYLPQWTRQSCLKPGYKTSIKRRICRQLAKSNFTTKPVPPEAYSVHWFLHTSYRQQKDKLIQIHRVLPMSNCVI